MGTGGDRFLVMKIDSPVTIRLESGTKARTSGPFGLLWIVDGMILHDLDQAKGDAEFDDDSNLWICPDGLLRFRQNNSLPPLAIGSPDPAQ